MVAAVFNEVVSQCAHCVHSFWQLAWCAALAAPHVCVPMLLVLLRLPTSLLVCVCVCVCAQLCVWYCPGADAATQQAAKLLCAFREYHRRAAYGLSGYYSQQLAAFEDVLLNAREALFSAQQQQPQQPQRPPHEQHEQQPQQSQEQDEEQLFKVC